MTIKELIHNIQAEHACTQEEACRRVAEKHFKGFVSPRTVMGWVQGRKPSKTFTRRIEELSSQR